VTDVSFYFDFNSPYAYLAAERIDGLVPDAEWKPIAFGILLGQVGRLGEALKRDPGVVLADVSGRAAERGLPPITPPESWPIESWSLMPLRAAVFAGERGLLREFSHAAYRKQFVDGLALAELDHTRAVAREVGLDPDEVAEAVQRPEIKERLKQNTDEALARGVTGIPTVAIGDELFWGDDRLDEAAAASRG
jgi:2-hydroxychromene-2-carboxylate isomerase